MSVRRFTHHAINGEFLTLDDLDMFVAEMKGERGMPGTAVVRFRTIFELNFDCGPRASAATAEAEPSADDLMAEQPVRAGDGQRS